MSKKKKPKQAHKGKQVEGNALLGTEAAVRKGLHALSTNGVVQTLRVAKTGIADVLAQSDRSLITKLAIVYGAGLVAQEDDDEWKALCEVEDWVDHPKLRPKRNDALRAVLRLAVGFNGKPSNSTVHRYHKALHPYFAKKVPAEEIPRIIRDAGGVEQMRQASPPTIEVNGQPEVINELFAVPDRTLYRARITVLPVNNGKLAISISKLKRAKATA
jgi:hypothetical protein